MLHITNGDCATDGLRQAGLPGSLLPWRDVLHEGPVPEGLSLEELSAVRAGFIAETGWRTLAEALAEFTERDQALAGSLEHDEVVLWFEHDLYDQLQLLQLLDWFSARRLGSTRLSLICGAEYLGPSTPQRLAERFPGRTPVSEAQLELGRRAWAAFRSPDPTRVTDLLAGDTTALPFLGDALLRHLQQFPSVRNGLSRSEHQALEALAAGTTRLGQVYVESHHQREEPVFLGDTVFDQYMGRLSRGPAPLLLRKEAESPWDAQLQLTEAGRAVLEGREDQVRLNGIDRWLGGVLLRGSEARWRWDEPARQLHPTAR